MRIARVWSGAVGVLLVSTILVAPSGAAAADPLINVPSEVPTIQAAIDAAPSGGSVLVAPGVYHEHIDFHGRTVEVRSSAGPASTVIDGGGTGTVVTFRQAETRATTLRGFTIRNGAQSGIRVLFAAPTIAGNIVTANNGGADGGGLYVYQSAPLIEGNAIQGNSAYNSGGGLYLLGDHGTEVVGNTVEDNIAGHGGGMNIWVADHTLVLNNLFRGNRGGGLENYSESGGPDVLISQNLVVDNEGSGLYLHSATFSQGPVVANNTVAGNVAPGYAITSSGDYLAVNNILSSPSSAAAVRCEGGSGRLLYNDVYNGTPTPLLWCPDVIGIVGNISADPHLAPDFGLTAASPAIDAGHDNPLQPVLGPTDANGATREVDGDGDGIATVDLGAYEWPGTGLQANVRSPARYHPLPPRRILDTRQGLGVPGRLGPGGTASLQVTGQGGVPATGVSAVVLNLTATEPTAGSFLTVWPAGEARPTASNLNDTPGRTVANLVTVRVGTGGRVNLYNYAGTVHVVADVAGWYGENGASTGTTFTPGAPMRVLDTRAAIGAPMMRVGPDQTVDLQLTPEAGVPASGVSAVVVNVTITEADGGGFLTVWPGDEARPLVSNLNYGPGETVANLVVVKVGASGSIKLYNSSGSTHVIADMAGWFGAGTEGSAGTYNAVNPTRLLDTRSGLGAPKAPVGPRGTISFQVAGRAGLPAGAVSAVVLNVTVTEPTAVSFLTASGGGARPTASNLNVVPGQTVANLVVVQVSADGKVYLYNNAGTAHVIADVAGWFRA